MNYTKSDNINCDTAYTYYQKILTELTNYIVSTPELQLITYIQNKNKNYLTSSLDTLNNSIKVMTNVNFLINTITSFEPITYFYTQNKLSNIDQNFRL